MTETPRELAARLLVQLTHTEGTTPGPGRPPYVTIDKPMLEQLCQAVLVSADERTVSAPGPGGPCSAMQDGGPFRPNHNVCPYACSLNHGHGGSFHEAWLDGKLLASWAVQ